MCFHLCEMVTPVFNIGHVLCLTVWKCRRHASDAVIVINGLFLGYVVCQLGAQASL